MASFSGKVAVVTGAGSGIGAAIARRLAGDGAAVVVSDIDADGAATIAREITDRGGRAIDIITDVTDENAVSDLVDRTVRELGGLHLMVNNAGVSEDPVPIDEKPGDVWRRVIDINLTGVFYGLKHAVRAMKASGDGGVVINIASILGLVGFNGAPAYVAAKHGVVGLTKAAAIELAPQGIRVVAVNPAFIRTPLIEGLEDQVLPQHPIGRLGEPEEVATLVAYLGSDEASFLTGATYLVDGGYTAQ